MLSQSLFMLICIILNQSLRLKSLLIIFTYKYN